MTRISLTEARRLNQIRDRLVDAVKYERTMPGLRARMVELAADVEAWRDGRTTSSAAFAAARDTQPCPPPAPSGRNLEASISESEQTPHCGCRNALPYAQWCRACHKAQALLDLEPATESEQAPSQPAERPSAGP